MSLVAILVAAVGITALTGWVSWLLWREGGRRQGLPQLILWSLALLVSLLFLGAGSCAGLITFAGLSGGLRF
jgi:hypothetical protein